MLRVIIAQVDASDLLVDCAPGTLKISSRILKKSPNLFRTNRSQSFRSKKSLSSFPESIFFLRIRYYSQKISIDIGHISLSTPCTWMPWNSTETLPGGLAGGSSKWQCLRLCCAAAAERSQHRLSGRRSKLWPGVLGVLIYRAFCLRIPVIKGGMENSQYNVFRPWLHMLAYACLLQ